MNPIVISNLSKSFGEKQVLDRFSAEVQRGAVTCLMGSSGSGKTTLLYLLMGLLTPDQGEIRGMDPLPLGVLFQEDRLCEAYSAVANVRLVCGKTVTQDQIEGELTKVGLGDSLHLPVSSLSGGMKRRVALVRAFFVPAATVLLDEPFKGLDIAWKKTIYQYILEKMSGKTGIVVTHQTEDVDRLGANLITLP